MHERHKTVFHHVQAIIQKFCRFSCQQKNNDLPVYKSTGICLHVSYILLLPLDHRKISLAEIKLQIMWRKLEKRKRICEWLRGWLCSKNFRYRICANFYACPEILLRHNHHSNHPGEHLKSEMAKIDGLYKLSYVSLSSRRFFSALWLIWPRFDILAILHVLYRLYLVLHRLGNSDHLQYGDDDYHDILTSCSTLPVKTNDVKGRWGSFSSNFLPVANVFHCDNNSLHFLIAHAVENIKWIKYTTAWRNARRPYHSIKEK